MTISPEEQLILDNLVKSRDAAIASIGEPCTPMAHNAVVNLGVQQANISILLYGKCDSILAAVSKGKDKIAVPKTFGEAFRLFMLKAPIPFSLIVVALIIWCMKSEISPKEIWSAKTVATEIAQP